MIVLDLEWNRGYDKTPLEEILQIGAVRLDKLGGTIQDTFSIFVHPCVHKKFNHTAKALPELASALNSPYDFPTALEAFVDWCKEDTVFVDWGGDDFDVLRQNCDFWKVPAHRPSGRLFSAGRHQSGRRLVPCCGVLRTSHSFHIPQRSERRSLYRYGQRLD